MNGGLRMQLKEIGANVRTWSDSAQYMYYWRPLLNVALSFQIPQVMGEVNNLY